jgi:hypothetical protein
MTVDERLVADYFTTGFTIGSHPMTYHRAKMDKAGVIRADDLKTYRTGHLLGSPVLSLRGNVRDVQRVHLHQ